MKIKLFDNVTVLAEPEEVYMLLLIHSKLTAPPKPVEDPEEHAPEKVTLFNAPETPESAAPSMVETPEAKPAPAKRIVAVDWSKAKALRKAGWSLAKIADELGVSVPTVSQHLKEVK